MAASTQPHSPEERAERKRRVQAAKTALRESSQLQGAQVASARSVLKTFLRQINEPRQPSDAIFRLMLEAPFAQQRRQP